MQHLIGILGILLSFNAFSARVLSQIHSIDIDQNKKTDLIFLKSGEVLKVSHLNQDMKEDLNEAKNQEAWLAFEINDTRNILAVQSTEDVSSSDSAELERSYNFALTPTILGSHAEAKNILKKFNDHYNRRRTECYQRAHIWAYESFKNFGLVTMKVFLFFTRKYIREYNYDWWFHTSPFTYVRDGASTVETVLDHTYIGKPISFQKWTNRFMDNNAYCPVITRYSQYSQHENDNYCYVFKTNMFYYQPLDLEALENQGTIKDRWITWEVNAAYKAFSYSTLNQ